MLLNFPCWFWSIKCFLAPCVEEEVRSALRCIGVYRVQVTSMYSSFAVCMVKRLIRILTLCSIVTLLFFNYLVLKYSVLNSLHFCEQTCTIQCIVKETGTNFHSSIHLPKDMWSMYRLLFTIGRLLYITYLQYVPSMVYVWKAAVHCISTVCTRHGLHLEGCCTLHIYSMTYIGFYLF